MYSPTAEDVSRSPACIASEANNALRRGVCSAPVLNSDRGRGDRSGPIFMRMIKPLSCGGPDKSSGGPVYVIVNTPVSMIKA